MKSVKQASAIWQRNVWHELKRIFVVQSFSDHFEVNSHGTISIKTYSRSRWNHSVRCGSRTSFHKWLLLMTDPHECTNMGNTEWFWSPQLLSIILGRWVALQPILLRAIKVGNFYGGLIFNDMATLLDERGKWGNIMMAVTATDSKNCAIELRSKVANYESLRFTYWLVAADLNCLVFICSPRRLLNDMERGPCQYNHSVNVVLDETVRHVWSAHGEIDF